MLKRILFAALLIFTLATTTNAKASEYEKITEPLTEKKMADLREFFELSGSVTAAINFADFMSLQMGIMIKQQYPDYPERLLDIVKDEVVTTLKADMYREDGLLDSLSLSYAQYFTHKEIKKINKFYKSKTGKKFADLSPTLAREGAKIGQLWGTSLEPQINKNILERCLKEGLDEKYCSFFDK